MLLVRQSSTVAFGVAHSARSLPGSGGPALFLAAFLLLACTSLLGFGARRLSEIQRMRGGLA